MSLFSNQYCSYCKSETPHERGTCLSCYEERKKASDSIDLRNWGHGYNGWSDKGKR